MIKSILSVAAAGSQVDDIAPVVGFSQAYNAYLSLLILDLARPAAVSKYGKALAIQSGEDYEHGEQAARETLSLLKQHLDLSSLRFDLSAAEQLPNEIESTLAQRARYADLTVFVSDSQPLSELNRHALHGAMMQSGKPVLVLPRGQSSFTFRRPMIAWDGGPIAARALHSAMSFVDAADEVHALMVDIAPGTDNPGQKLVDYLAHHEVSLTLHTAVRDGRRFSELLLEKAAENQADLIIMGGYGQSRLHEFVFGSTTERVLNGATLPVFFSH